METTESGAKVTATVKGLSVEENSALEVWKSPVGMTSAFQSIPGLPHGSNLNPPQPALFTGWSLKTAFWLTGMRRKEERMRNELNQIFGYLSGISVSGYQNVKSLALAMDMLNQIASRIDSGELIVRKREEGQNGTESNRKTD